MGHDEHIVQNNPKREAKFAAIAVLLFAALVGLVVLSALWRGVQPKPMIAAPNSVITPAAANPATTVGDLNATPQTPAMVAPANTGSSIAATATPGNTATAIANTSNATGTTGATSDPTAPATKSAEAPNIASVASAPQTAGATPVASATPTPTDAKPVAEAQTAVTAAIPAYAVEANNGAPSSTRASK